MKAIFLKPTNAGILNFVEETIPVPSDIKSHEICIEVFASSFQSSTVYDEDKYQNDHNLIGIGLEVAGVVNKVGESVTSLKINDRVTGFIDVRTCKTGCAEFAVLSSYLSVKIPDTVSFADAAACLRDAVQAYTSLQFQAHIKHGDVVLVTNATSGLGLMTTQLAQLWGGKVIATFTSDSERSFLGDMQEPPSHLIEIQEKSSHLHTSLMEETGGIGADIIVENGVRMFSERKPEEKKCALPMKHDIISCLTVGGHWITQHPFLQLDPPDCNYLHLKCASICFLNSNVWTMASKDRGRFQHILHDIVDKISANSLTIHIAKRLDYNDLSNWKTVLEKDHTGHIVITRT